VVQFFKTVVDYSRVENTQFEDDDYYYYVKAVPKLQTGNKNKNRVASQPGTTARRESAAVRNEAPVDRAAR
jgi:hypothetical protein